jgi:hypothetical protein
MNQPKHKVDKLVVKLKLADLFNNASSDLGRGAKVRLNQDLYSSSSVRCETTDKYFKWHLKEYANILRILL